MARGIDYDGIAAGKSTRRFVADESDVMRSTRCDPLSTSQPMSLAASTERCVNEQPLLHCKLAPSGVFKSPAPKICAVACALVSPLACSPASPPR